MTTTPRTLRLEYSLPDASLRGNSRAHHMAKYRVGKKMRFDAGLMGRDAGHSYTKARITYHFYHSRKIDLNNLAIGMKLFEDGLVDANVIPDDDPDHLVQGEHTFTKIRRLLPGHWSRVEIVVEEIA